MVEGEEAGAGSPTATVRLEWGVVWCVEGRRRIKEESLEI